MYKQCCVCQKVKINNNVNFKINTAGYFSSKCRDCINRECRYKRRGYLFEGRQDGRICTGCKTFKLFCNFYKDASLPTGHDQRCKACKNAYNQSPNQLANRRKANERWRKANIGFARKYANDYYRKQRENASSSYVKTLLVSAGMTTKSKALIELKTADLLLKRAIKAVEFKKPKKV